MEKRAICPIFLAASQSTSNMFCQKGNCAWYDKDADKCAVLGIAHNLKDVTYELNNILYAIQ